MAGSRVFALSDIHVDSPSNMRWLEGISEVEYTHDALILAGDVCDRPGRLERTLALLKARFARVCFVPGNHELWVRGRSRCADSLEKFERVLALCSALGVETGPVRTDGVWIVPLFSWYRKPEEGADSLFVPKPGEDPTLAMWSDNHFARWPAAEAPADRFLRMNEARLGRAYDAPVVSFSHFLPRRELIFSAPEERAGRGAGRDPHPAFNFSRVAGCAGLDRQIRELGSAIHVYGHQHRNRWREIEGVAYVSHCLGYPREREKGRVRGIGEGPRLIWDGG